MKWTDRIIEHRRMRVGDLLPHDRNPKKHGKAQTETVAAILQKFGKVDSIIAWPSQRQGGRLATFDGNLRRGLDPNEEWDVAITDLSDAEADELVLYYDPVTALAELEKEQTAALLAEVTAGDANLQALLDKLAQEAGIEPDLPDDPGAQVDRAEELRAKWGVKSGQLWAIGEHRLICGDCTDAAVVERVMQGEKASLVVTDPPYGVAYGDLIAKDLNRTRQWKRITNDDLQDEELQAFLEKAIKAWVSVVQDNAAWYLWHAQKTQGFFTAAAAAAAAAAAGIIYHRQIVWVKPQLILGRGHYHWRHELCLYGWRQGYEPTFYGGHNKTTVWEFDSPGVERLHPTQKALECFEWPVENSTLVGGIVLDPFLGSGTTLVACERLGRRGRGIERAPQYCAVTLERLSQMGLEPRLVG